MDATKYGYSAVWSEEDGEYVGLCAEFPSLSWLAKDEEAALRGIRNLVKTILAEMEQNGEEIPEARRAANSRKEEESEACHDEKLPRKSQEMM